MIRVVKLEKPHYGLLSDRFSPALRAACNAVPGMRWEGGPWRGYPDAISSVLRILKKQGVLFDKSALPKPGDYGEPLMPVADSQLRDYQKVGVRFLLNQGPTGALLADGMGVGKSAQAMTAARALREKTLVVCPSYVRGVWAHLDASREKHNKGQIQRWWPAARNVCTPEGVNPFTPLRRATKAELTEGRKPLHHKMVDGRFPSVLENADVVVIHYDIVYAWVEVLLQWGYRTLILDEAHLALQSAKSRRGAAVALLARHASAKFALTGTPPVERPRDLWNLIDTISPGRMGHFFNYGLTFCAGQKVEVTKDKIVWQFDGKSNLKTLSRRLRYFMLRRTVQDVRLELPPMTRQIIDVEIPAKKRVMATGSILKSSKAMREVLNLAADGKLNPSIELIAGHAQEGHHVIVFTWRRAIASYIANAMAARDIPADVIFGGVPGAKRRERIENAKLQTCHVMACTIDSTSTGIDLSYADVAVFVELTWEPHELAQAEARVNRFGQERPTLIQYVIARGTGDELVLDAVIHKLDTFEAVIGTTGDGLRRELEGNDKGGGLEALAKRLEEMEREQGKKKCRT
jgi:SNF2 family DNA or RNA helicase